MLKNRTQITVLTALTISIFINLPRLLVTLNQSELASQFGLTIEDVLLRSIVMFCFAWLVLSFNFSWEDSLSKYQLKHLPYIKIAVNICILLFAVSVLTLLKQVIFPGYLEGRKLFFMTLFSYSVVQILLLLLAHLVNLNFSYQKNLLEKEQAKQKALQHQLQALRTQINPHFLFNSLNSLSTLIRQKPEKASSFVDKLSWLLRATLQRSEQDFISLQEELEYLEAYIFLQKERFGAKFKVTIDIPDDWKKEIIPSFSLQLLVENAIKHNVVSKRQPLEVKIYSDSGFLIVRNPIQARRDAVESTGIGLSNLSTRFNLLKKRSIEIHKDEQFFVVKLPVFND